MKDKNTYLLESIKILNNKIYNLDYHKERIARSLELNYKSLAQIDFDSIVKEIKKIDTGLHKLRLIYNDSFLKYELHPYQIKSIRTLQLISSNSVGYSHKFLDRTHLDKLYKLKRNADDILIVKNGMITDTYYCNVALLKDEKWMTPKVPLLKGTKRQQLIDDAQISEKLIYMDDLLQYDRIRLFNALIEFGDIDLDIKQII